MTDAIDIVPAWQRLPVEAMQGLVMVVGASDTGKTTVCRYLADRLMSYRQRVCLIDADPGQSRLGPPTLLTLERRERPSKNGATENTRRWFIGSTTPAGHMLQTLAGCARLFQKARDWGPAPVVMDTSGLVDAEKGGARLKLAKIDLLQPELLIVLQKARELESWMQPLRVSRRVPIIDLPSAPAVRAREVMERQTYREESFGRYFQTAVRQNFYWPRYGVYPYPGFYPNRLMAFEDPSGFALGLGIIKDFDEASRTVFVLTPLSRESAGRVRSMQLGDVMIEPSNFRHTLMDSGLRPPDQFRTGI